MEGQLIGSYTNGNCTVSIFSDGTKVRETKDDEFRPVFPESIDFKITNRCAHNCPMCHEDSKPDGAHADLDKLPFIDTLPAYTEVAIGGGNPLEHPRLPFLLDKLCAQKVIANITVNVDDFLEHTETLKSWVDAGLIHGVGVSISSCWMDEHTLRKIIDFPNSVIHVIAGLLTPTNWIKLMYENRGGRVLILGYKKVRKGTRVYDKHASMIETGIGWLSDNIEEVCSCFDIVSFDNLAIEQLHLQDKMKPEAWDEFYMGNDGQFTMYIDGVKREFAKSSTTMERHAVTDSIFDMFAIIKS